jgi:hypothetical protein
MARPNTIWGLLIVLLRSRGITTRALAATLATGALITLAWRSHSTPTRYEAHEPWLSQPGAPSEAGAVFFNPTLTATPSGWLLAWTRWEFRKAPSAQVAALARDGSLRGEVVTLTPSDQSTRNPRFARGADATAVVWDASPSGAFNPHVWFATLGDDGRVRGTPRRLDASSARGFYPQVAWDGEGWGVSWRTDHGIALARLKPDGSPRGDLVRVRDESVWIAPSLVWSGDAWLVAHSTYRRENDESNVRLRWFDRGGNLVSLRDLGNTQGEPWPAISTASRGAATWLVWGEDGSFTPRHDPRIARVEGRTVALGPRPLGPRRSGSVPAIACASDACTLAWAAIPPQTGATAELYVQRTDLDGAPLAPPRSVGAKGLARPWSIATVALSGDASETLAVWDVRHDNQSGALLVARFDASGEPLAPPRELPLR